MIGTFGALDPAAQPIALWTDYPIPQLGDSYADRAPARRCWLLGITPQKTSDLMGGFTRWWAEVRVVEAGRDVIDEVPLGWIYTADPSPDPDGPAPVLVTAQQVQDILHPGEPLLGQ